MATNGRERREKKKMEKKVENMTKGRRKNERVIFHAFVHGSLP